MSPAGAVHPGVFSAHGKLVTHRGRERARKRQSLQRRHHHKHRGRKQEPGLGVWAGGWGWCLPFSPQEHSDGNRSREISRSLHGHGRTLLFPLVVPREGIPPPHVAAAPASGPTKQHPCVGKPSSRNNHRQRLPEKEELMESYDWAGYGWGHTSLVS